MNRRQFLRGAAVLAPAVILTPGLLMPVRTLSAPDDVLTVEKLRRAVDILKRGEVGRWYGVSVWLDGELQQPGSSVFVNGALEVPRAAQHVRVETPFITEGWRGAMTSVAVGSFDFGDRVYI